MKRNQYWLLILYLLPLIVLPTHPLWAQYKRPPEALAQGFVKHATAKIQGKVIWKGQDLSQTTVQVYRDMSLKDLYTGVTQLKGGEFEIRVEPGDYYLVTFVDVNHSGKFDSGDGMGIFGITDWKDSNQQKQAIRIADGQTISGMEIIVTARMQDVGGRGQIVSIDDYRVNPAELFKKELSMISSGIKGQLTDEGVQTFKNALVFAYTDLSWKYRAGEARVEADGSFTLNLTPGKYYLMAIIDENQTNLFDTGDELGIYGIEDLRDSQMFPQPILVKGNQFTENIQITITGRQLENRKIVSLDEPVKESYPPETATAKVSGEVRWEGHPLKGSMVQIYQDATLLKEIEQGIVDENGKFSLQLPPGNYYLIANVDADGDGRYSSGDGLGGYGTANITVAPPSSISLKEGGNPDIEIFVSAQYNSAGQLEAISGGNIDSASNRSGGISGQIRWDGKTLGEGILSISETPDFQSPVAILLKLEEDGRYEVSLPPGDYYVMAIVDRDGDHKADLKDGVGIYGTRHPVRATPQLVSVFPGYIAPHIDIEIFATYIDADGNIAEIEDGHRSEIQFQYGEPEDVFKFTRFGRQIEEWWYWTQGVGFSFEAVGTGWKLQNRKDFEPKVIDPEQLKQLEQQFNHAPVQNAQNQSETTPLNALIYYSYDNLIWGYAPNGIYQPLGAGEHPTASRDGRLIFQDDDGNVIAFDSDQEKQLLGRRELASDVTISPDGDFLAFARQGVDRRRLYIRHIPSGKEIAVPSTAIEMFTPAWDISGELLAYSARGSIENPDAGENRNIYFYDQLSGQIEPISIEKEDDAEPAWSPSNPNILAFSRAQGSHRQIWLVEFSPKGEPGERQLTRYGGEKPVWLPNGSEILYENNGQLWLISSGGSDNRLVMVKGRVIFGHEPCAIPPPIQ